jgi:hypothetical protein
VEWNYGEYEGLTPQQIHAVRPGWMIFTDGCPGGEDPDQVEARIDRVIARIRTVSWKGQCGRILPRSPYQSVCGAVARTSSGRWPLFPSRSGDCECHELLSRRPRRQALAPILSPNSKDRLAAQSDSSRRATSQESLGLSFDLESTAAALVAEEQGNTTHRAGALPVVSKFNAPV